VNTNINPAINILILKTVFFMAWPPLFEFDCLDDRSAKRVYKYLIGKAFSAIGKEVPPCKFPLLGKGG
jgi:hypothetical protein